MAAGDPTGSNLGERGEEIRADGSMLRQLHAFLAAHDPSEMFGGLVKVQNKRREFLWVQSRFVDEY